MYQSSVRDLLVVAARLAMKSADCAAEKAAQTQKRYIKSKNSSWPERKQNEFRAACESAMNEMYELELEAGRAVAALRWFEEQFRLPAYVFDDLAEEEEESEVTQPMGQTA